MGLGYLGKGARTTMIYTHVFNYGGKGVHSPIGSLQATLEQECYAETIRRRLWAVASLSLWKYMDYRKTAAACYLKARPESWFI